MSFYNKHVMSDPRQLLLDEGKLSSLSYDRREIVSELKPFATILVSNGIFKLIPFYQLFKDFGFNSGEIGNIIKFITSNLSKEFCPVTRVFNKANFSEKNLMFTSLSLILKNDELNQFLSKYLSLFHPNFKRKDELIKNYKKLNNEVIERASKYTQSINISSIIDIHSISHPQNRSHMCKLPGIESFDFVKY